MATGTIRIRPKSHKALKEIAEMTGQSLQDVLEVAIENHQRRLYLEGANEDYARLKKDPKAYADLLKEFGLWDVTNLDGLSDL